MTPAEAREKYESAVRACDRAGTAEDEAEVESAYSALIAAVRAEERARIVAALRENAANAAFDEESKRWWYVADFVAALGEDV